MYISHSQNSTCVPGCAKQVYMFYMCTCSLLLHSDVLILIQLRQQRGPSQDPKTGVRQTGQPYPHDKICTLTRRRQHPSSFTGFAHWAVVRLCPSLLLCRLLLLNNSRTHTKEQHIASWCSPKKNKENKNERRFCWRCGSTSQTMLNVVHVPATPHFRRV